MGILEQILPIVADTLLYGLPAVAAILLFFVHRLIPMFAITAYTVGAYATYWVWYVIEGWISKPSSAMAVYSVGAMIVGVTMVLAGIWLIAEYGIRHLYGKPLWLQLLLWVSIHTSIIYLMTTIGYTEGLSITIGHTIEQWGIYISLWDGAIFVITVPVWVCLFWFFGAKKMQHMRNHEQSKQKKKALMVLALALSSLAGGLVVPKIDAYPMMGYDIVFSILATGYLGSIGGALSIGIAGFLVNGIGSLMVFDMINPSSLIVISLMLIVSIYRPSFSIKPMDIVEKRKIVLSKPVAVALFIMPIIIAIGITQAYYIIYAGLVFMVSGFAVSRVMKYYPTTFLGYGLFFALAVYCLSIGIALNVSPWLVSILVLIGLGIAGYGMGGLFYKISAFKGFWLSLTMTVWAGYMLQSVDNDATQIILGQWTALVSPFNGVQKSAIIGVLAIGSGLLMIGNQYLEKSLKKISSLTLSSYTMGLMGMVVGLAAILLLITQQYVMSAGFILSYTWITLGIAIVIRMVGTSMALPMAISLASTQGRSENIAILTALILGGVAWYLYRAGQSMGTKNAK